MLARCLPTVFSTDADLLGDLPVGGAAGDARAESRSRAWSGRRATSSPQTPAGSDAELGVDVLRGRRVGGGQLVVAKALVRHAPSTRTPGLSRSATAGCGTPAAPPATHSSAWRDCPCCTSTAPRACAAHARKPGRAECLGAGFQFTRNSFRPRRGARGASATSTAARSSRIRPSRSAARQRDPRSVHAVSLSPRRQRSSASPGCGSMPSARARANAANAPSASPRSRRTSPSW